MAAGMTTLAVTLGVGCAEATAGCVTGICRRSIGCIQSVAQAVGRSFFDILVFHPPLRQQDLAAGRQFDVVGRVQILQHLLRDPLEHRRGNLSALMQADRANPESPPP